MSTFTMKDCYDEKEHGFRCWCSEGIHSGDYAQEDWIHHHCIHPELIYLGLNHNEGVPDSEGIVGVMCLM